MNRRSKIATALATMALGAVVATAGPAQAAGYTLYGQYFYQDECNYYGATGVTNHQWTAYYCTWTPIAISPGSGIDGVADLYVN